MDNSYKLFELFELDGTHYATLTTWNPRHEPRPVTPSIPDDKGRVEVTYNNCRYRCRMPTR